MAFTLEPTEILVTVKDRMARVFIDRSEKPARLFALTEILIDQEDPAAMQDLVNDHPLRLVK